jgi:uracil-DNA glycosylase
VMLVGEQPGDKEDLAGQPFVGPAGQMLDRALVEAGIDRSKVYITNAVKHFKFVPRGKIRLHQKPNTAEIRACRPWYERELAAIKPVWWWRWALPPRKACSARSRRSTGIADA